jgi:mannose-6-phosphate isomerase-like protein (cupin superfamily)
MIRKISRTSARVGRLSLIAAAGLLLTGAGMPGQGADQFDNVTLLRKADTMVAEAKSSPNGLATAILQRWPTSFIEVVVRVKDGQSEQHAAFADLFMPLEGTADVVVGGTLLGGKDTAQGEIRGSGLDGGVHHVLRPGMMLRVPPGVPHQTMTERGKTLKYIVIKIAEHV